MGGPGSGRPPNPETIARRMAAPNPIVAVQQDAAYTLPPTAYLREGAKKSKVFNAGSVVFIDSNLDFAEDNSNLFWDDTNNRLGIGTTSPTSKLHVNGSIEVNGNNPLTYYYDGARSGTYGISTVANQILTGSGVGDLNIRSAQGNINFGVNAIQAVLQGSTGRVGIGVASPSTSLDVSGSINTNSTYAINTANVLGVSGSNIELGSATYPNVVLQQTSGRVGIGTTTPDSLLEVNGTVKFTNQADNAASLIWSPTAEGGAGTLTTGYYYSYNGYRSTSNSNLVLQQHGTAADILFNIAGANTKMIIDQDGKVGIGTITPLTLFHLSGGAYTISNTTAPSTPTNAGAIFVSSGECWYIGGSGTQTRLAIA